MAHVNLEIGNLPTAESISEKALSLLPNYPRALLVMAQVRLLQGQPADSVQLLRQSYKSVPQTATLSLFQYKMSLKENSVSNTR
jgi:predicted Zn-dependent protease